MSRDMHVHAIPSAFACAAGHSPAREIVQLRMTEQELNSTQVFGPFVDQRRLGPPHRMGAVDRGI